MKTIGLTEKQYDEIIDAGKKAGFNMNAGRNGQRAKFLVFAARMAEFVISSVGLEEALKGEMVKNE